MESCTKTILVKVYKTDHPNVAKTVYAIIDDQSNRSLAKSEFFEHFGISVNKLSTHCLRALDMLQHLEEVQMALLLSPLMVDHS